MDIAYNWFAQENSVSLGDITLPQFKLLRFEIETREIGLSTGNDFLRWNVFYVVINIRLHSPFPCFLCFKQSNLSLRLLYFSLQKRINFS